jgi:hypothetical protein
MKVKEVMDKKKDAKGVAVKDLISKTMSKGKVKSLKVKVKFGKDK